MDGKRIHKGFHSEWALDEYMSGLPADAYVVRVVLNGNRN